MTRAKKNTANARNNLRGTANKAIQRVRNTNKTNVPSLDMAVRNSGYVDRTHVEMQSHGAGSLTVKGYEHVINAFASSNAQVDRADTRDMTAMYRTHARRLRYLAGAFDYWRPKKLVYHYRPKVGTTVAGRLTMAYDRGMPKMVMDYNTGEHTPVYPGPKELLYFQPIVSGPVWQNSRLEIDLEKVVSRKWYSTAPNTFATFDSTDRYLLPTEDGILGSLYTDVSDGDPALLNKQVGDVWMEYEIEFAGPVIPTVRKPISFDCLRGAWLASPAGGAVFQRDNILQKPYRVALVWGVKDGAGGSKVEDGKKLQIGIGYEPTSTFTLSWVGPWSGTLSLIRGSDSVSVADFNAQGEVVKAALMTAGYQIPEASSTTCFINFLVTAPVGKVSNFITVEWKDGISYLLCSKGIGNMAV